MTVEAVIFDVGGVLLLPSGDRMAAAIEAETGLHLDPAACRDAWTRAVVDLDQPPFVPAAFRSGGGEAPSPLEARWVHHAGVPDGLADAAVRAVRAVNAEPRSLWSETVPGGRATLDRLAEAGYRLAVVSNSDGRVAGQLEEEGLADPFEVIIDSAIVEIEKPDPRIFDICLARMGALRADRCLYVGDTLTFDVVGASKAGLTPIHFDRLGLYPAPPEGLRRIRSLEEVR